MKRRALIRSIEQQASVFVRHGGKYGWYQNPTTKVRQPTLRHREIKEHLTRALVRKMASVRAPESEM